MSEPLTAEADDVVHRRRQSHLLDAVIEWSAAEDAYGDAVKGLPPEQWNGTTRDTPEWTALRAARDRQRAAYSALRAFAKAQQREGTRQVGNPAQDTALAQQREGAGE